MINPLYETEAFNKVFKVSSGEEQEDEELTHYQHGDHVFVPGMGNSKCCRHAIFLQYDYKVLGRKVSDSTTSRWMGVIWLYRTL